MVVVRGYEGGVNEVAELKSVKLKLDHNEAWYYGKHKEAFEEDKNFDCKAIKLMETED